MRLSSLKSVFRRTEKIGLRDRLSDAIFYDDFESVVLALEEDANPNATVNGKHSPLREAVDFANDIRILDALLAAGANAEEKVYFHCKAHSLAWAAREMKKPEFAQRLEKALSEKKAFLPDVDLSGRQTPR